MPTFYSVVQSHQKLRRRLKVLDRLAMVLGHDAGTSTIEEPAMGGPAAEVLCFAKTRLFSNNACYTLEVFHNSQECVLWRPVLRSPRVLDDKGATGLLIFDAPADSSSTSDGVTVNNGIDIDEVVYLRRFICSGHCHGP